MPDPKPMHVKDVPEPYRKTLEKTLEWANTWRKELGLPLLNGLPPSFRGESEACLVGTLAPGLNMASMRYVGFGAHDDRGEAEQLELPDFVVDAEHYFEHQELPGELYDPEWESGDWVDDEPEPLIKARELANQVQVKIRAGEVPYPTTILSRELWENDEQETNA